MGLIPVFIKRRIEKRPQLNKIVYNILWLFFDKILRMGLGLMIAIWVARYLGPAQFGILSFAIAFTGLFGAVANLGLQGIVVRELIKDRQSAPKIIGSAALLQIFSGCLAYLMIILVISQIRPDDPLTRNIVMIAGGISLFKASEVSLYWFESQVQSKYVVWVQNGVFLVFASIKATLILNDYPLEAFAWAILAEAGALALMLMIVMNHQGLSLSSLHFTGQWIKNLLRDSWPLTLSGIAVVVYMKIGQIMLGQMAGEEAVGIYTAAISISEVWYFLPLAIVASVTPSILEAKQRSNELYLSRLQKLYASLVWICIIISIPMTFIATPLIEFLYGTSYRSGGTILAIHIWASVFVCLGVASSQYLLAENRQVIALQRTIAGMLMNIGLNILLIPIYGSVGAALSSVCSQAFATLIFDLFQKNTKTMFLMKIRAFNVGSIWRS
jgi:O-antigen/teichoic acid export membrane protein